MTYIASSWYWSGSFMPMGMTWSSATLSYIPSATDPNYLAFVASGARATTIQSAPDLIQVMLDQVVPVLQDSGIKVTSTGTPALNGAYSMDNKSQRQITGIQTGINAGVPAPSGGYPWANSNGPVMLTGAQMTALGTAILMWELAIASYITAAVTGQSATLPLQTGTIP